MVKAGITGGIGSGKSIVCRLFSLLGIPTYDADRSARILMEKDPVLRQNIRELMGPEVFQDDGTLNRKFMGDKIFRDPALLQAVNEKVHPRVLSDYYKWVIVQQQFPYTLFESAILIETGIYQQMDHVIVVNAPESLRVNRIRKRDHRSEQEARTIISRQWSSELIKKYASFVIENDDRHLLIPQVLETDARIRQHFETGISS